MSYLSSPVPDLASTLVTQTEAAAVDENVRFLRTGMDSTNEQLAQSSSSDPQSDPRHQRLERQLNQLQRVNQSNRTLSGNQGESGRTLQTRDRMLRVLTRLSRLEEGNSNSSASQSQHQPSTAIPPGASASATRVEEEAALLEDIMGEMRRDNPTMHPEVMHIMARSQLDRERDIHGQARARMHPPSSLSEIQNRTQAHHERLLQERRTEMQALERRLNDLDRRNDSLRSTAIMQHARTSNSTERMLRYIRDREHGQAERDGQGEDSEPRPTSRWQQDTSSQAASSTTAPDLYSLASSQARSDRERFRDTDARLNAYRREYLSDHPNTHQRAVDRKTSSPSVSPCLENAIKYLNRVKDCLTFDDALATAIDCGFGTKEFLADKHEDFFMDVGKQPPPQPSSWLSAGASFDGSQHTSYIPESDHMFGTPASYRAANTHEPTRSFDATRPWLSHAFVVPRIQPERISSTSSQPLEHWPVKVIIHSTDETNMTLTGTMEAFDVPNQSPSTISSLLSHATSTRTPSDKPITTFLEGHIIDFKTHTLMTPVSPASTSTTANHRPQHPVSYTPNITFPPTTASIDASNWRRLPPFAAIKEDDEVARVMLSHKRMAAINNEYIFMRWKERCFIHSREDKCAQSPRSRNATTSGSQSHGRMGEGDDTDTGHGLTISGFYYVSLRRSDGRVEGLYFDPSTSPYQCLRLKGVRGGSWGAWQLS